VALLLQQKALSGKGAEGENQMKRKAILSSEEFTKCVEFHGHTCPGLAIGFQASRTLMKRLGVRKAPDEELLAIVETDACGADAVQVMTGCTFGKGNFIFKNYGKHAFSLLDRKKRRALRASLLPGALDIDPRQISLSEKIRKEEASPEEKARFKQIQEERTQTILRADPESLFKVEEIFPDIPPKATIMESEICDFCGEPAKIDLLRKINGKRICIPCAKQNGSDKN
jgi:formylmethanofuran dehydrogenase subunit E